LGYSWYLTTFLGGIAETPQARALREEVIFLNIQKMKLRAFHLRQLFDLKKKRKEKMIKEYARLIWLINELS
jgi:hypothetical protein